MARLPFKSSARHRLLHRHSDHDGLVALSASNREPRAPNAPVLPIVTALLSLLFFSLGLRWIPQTRRRAYTLVGLLGVTLLVGIVAGCGGGSGSGGGGNRTITATYPGDTNYTGSNSNVSITVQ